MTARAEPSTLSLQIVRVAVLGVGALFALTPFATPALALAAGLFVALGVGNPWTRLTGSVSSGLLKIAVVALGFGISLETLIAAGSSGIVYTVILIVAVFAVGLLLGRWLAIDRSLTILISAGTSICGGSAIAAVGPAIGASREAMSVSLAAVFVLNAVALYVFPPIGHFFGLSEHQFSVWAAFAIHDTSSVVGAATSFGRVAVQEATVLKLARALWILPLVLIAPFLARGMGTKRENGRLPIPWFIALFVLAAVLRSIAAPDSIVLFDSTARAGRIALVLTLFLIGTSITRDELRTVGIRPLMHAFLLWLAVSIPTLFAVHWVVPQ